MKIRSKFRDFYDSVANMGIDEKILYIRKPREVDSVVGNLDSILREAPSNRSTETPGLYFEPFVIFFAGEIYQGGYVQTLVRDAKVSWWPKVVSRGFFYDFESLDTFLSRKESFTGYQTKKYALTEAKLKDYFRNKHVPDEAVLEYTHKVGSPIVLVTYRDHQRWPEPGRDRDIPPSTINPNLGELDFFKVKDPYSAFQEIQGYIGGVLGGSAPAMITLSDEIKRDKQGFDNWSFKTRPGTKKKRGRK